MAEVVEPDWIAVDWGTSNLRAWAMVEDSAVAQVSAPVGMGNLSREEFEPALLKTIGPWLDPKLTTFIVACGMVGARQGWQEVPYVSVPSPPLVPAEMGKIAAKDHRIKLTIIHGLSQQAPADVMRGEETQIAGLLALEPGFEGLACLPGTHSKWVRIQDGRIHHFRTFMTGELFALLSTQSVLRHSVTTDAVEDGTAFEAAVAQVAASPADLGALLFSIRASGLVGQADAAASKARLSGLLIGQEVEATRREWQDRDVVLIGAGPLCDSYAKAFSVRGGTARLVDAQACTLAGLVAARHALLEAA